MGDRGVFCFLLDASGGGGGSCGGVILARRTDLGGIGDGDFS